MTKLPLIFAATIMPSCAVIAVTSSMGLSASRSSLDETKIAEFGNFDIYQPVVIDVSPGATLHDSFVHVDHYCGDLSLEDWKSQRRYPAAQQ